jgi:uncharacterized protein (TIGR02118 family)
MIKVSVLYSSGDGSTLDMDYYCARQMALVRRLLSPTLKGVEIEEGIGGLETRSPPAYLAIGNLLFESAQAFQSAFELHAMAIIGEIPNYTNSRPTIQMSEAKLP